MPDSTQQQRLNQDLGLGGKLSERSRARLLNHDGTFNVRRNNLSPFHPYNVYHTLLSQSLSRLFAMAAAAYFGMNLLFASLYWLAGPGAIEGALLEPLGRFEDCLFFSFQTLATTRPRSMQTQARCDGGRHYVGDPHPITVGNDSR